MKIGVSSYSYWKPMEKGMDYYAFLDSAKELGFEGVEFIDLELKYARGEKTVEELAANLRAYCGQIGMPIVSYTIGANLVKADEGKREAECRRVMGCVDIAALLGAGLMRHDVGYAIPQGTRDWQDMVALAVPSIRRITEYAQTKGIRTCTENHGLILQDSARMEYLIRAVDRPNYGWLLDMGNFLCADEDPAVAAGVAAPYAFHVHAKDFLRKPGTEGKPEGGWWFPSRGHSFLRGTVVGHGVVPVRQIIRMLKRVEYDGYIDIEFEGMEDPIEALAAGCAYLKRALAEE